MAVVKFVPPRVPLVDLRNGTITREWYLLFQSLFDASDTGTVPDDQLANLAPASPDVQAFNLTTAIEALSDELNQLPPTQDFHSAPDNVSPEIGALREEVAMLRAALDDLQKGLVVI